MMGVKPSQSLSSVVNPELAEESKLVTSTYLLTQSPSLVTNLLFKISKYTVIKCNGRLSNDSYSAVVSEANCQRNLLLSVEL